MVRLAAFVCGVLCLMQLPRPGDCGGYVHFRWDGYYNPQGKDANGVPCDHLFWGIASTPCDFYFYFSMSGASGQTGSGWNTIRTQTVWEANSLVFSTSLGPGLTNPRVGGFSVWHNRLTYSLRVYDDDKLSGHDDVDFISRDLNIPADGRERSYIDRGRIHGHNTHFSFTVKVGCYPNYHGAHCATYCQPQNSNYYGHYTCDENGHKVCRPGWRNVANNCKDRNFCHSSPCQNGGVCSNTATTFLCSCPVQYKGTTCAIRRTPCELNNRCQNGARCRNAGTSAVCDCVPGWKGPTCAQDVNECALRTKVCFNNATCINTYGSYRCHCAFGFAGRNCSENIDECKASVTSPCKNGGVCIDSPGSFSCKCLPGFEGSKCESDINECNKAGTCMHNGTCRNTHGGFNCSCKPQYKGHRCEMDVNECAQTPNPCKNGGTCNNTNGSFKCVCPTGLQGPTCEEDVNECKVNSDYCEHGGTCENYFGGARCHCPPTRTGAKCELDVNECSTIKPCRNSGNCTNLENEAVGYFCNCDGTGYHGTNCTIDIDECAQALPPCANHATCINTVGGFRCLCPSGLRGPTCMVDVNECAQTPSPCKNGGTCNNTHGSFKCVCPTGWQGPTCEGDVNECAQTPSPCKNGGTCKNTRGSFKCSCPTGRQGPTCEGDVNKCAQTPSPCKNGGTCKNTRGSFKCSCPTGLLGPTCEEDVNECKANSDYCLHGGTCENYFGGARCHCLSTRIGEKCELDANECPDSGKACPSGPKTGALGGLSGGKTWIPAVVVIFVLLILVAIGAFFFYRRRSHLPEALKNRLGLRERTQSTVHFSNATGAGEETFENSVYTIAGVQQNGRCNPEAPNVGDFDNAVYVPADVGPARMPMLSFQASTGGRQNDYDNSDYAAIHEAGTLPVGAPQRYDGSPYVSLTDHNNYNQESTTDPTLPTDPEEEEQLSAEEGFEDEEAYAQLPSDVYSTLSRGGAENKAGIEQSISPVPPPLPPREGRSGDISQA